MTLPPRDSHSEQQFVLQLHQAQPSKIHQAITMAIEERRPMLAAQLFLLLDNLTPLSQELRKAHKALGFSFISSQHWLKLEQAWEDFAPSRRLQRMKHRHRDKDDLRNRPWKRR